MKILIEVEPKEIAELLGIIRLNDSKLADAKKQIVDDIADAIKSSLEYSIKLGLAHNFSEDAEKQFI